MSNNPWANQINNKSFLSPSGFKFSLVKKPKVDFFCSQVSIPRINLGAAIQASYLKQIPIPGDVLSYDDLVIKFNVDEDMENYLEVHNWLTQFGFPSSVEQYQQLLNEDELNPGKQTAISGMSDASIIVYNSNYNPNIRVDFKNLFPVSLSTIEFNSQINDIQYVTAEAVFKYTIYNITKIDS